MELVNLNIERLVIHQIFERDENKNVIPPRYNNRLSSIPEEGISALRTRIISALGNNSSSIDMDIIKAEEKSTFQILAHMIYIDDEQFLLESKKIADRLAACQTTRKIPGGIIVIISGTLGVPPAKYIMVIKAESQEGFALESKEDSLELLFMQELLLTPQQKLYKIGIFIEKECATDVSCLKSPDEFKAIVFDQNMNSAETKNAAIYFYDSFLGCAIHSSNKKLTRDFYNHTKTFIKELNVSDEAKLDYQNALYDYLKTSREPVISVAGFATRYFAPEIFDQYSNYMRSKNFPANSISKDLDLIKGQLKRRRIKFTSKVTITAPSDAFENLVKIIKQEETRTILSIEGKIQEQQ